MSKIYDLYSPDQRKIDNLKRRIRGYQKMEKDLQRDIRKTNNKNRELQQRIDEVNEEIFNYLISEDYCSAEYKYLPDFLLKINRIIGSVVVKGSDIDVNNTN